MKRMIVILGGARDYHAVDWYRAVAKVADDRRVMMLTDTVDGEGFRRIVTEKDDIAKLFVIDRILLPRGSRIADIWRNILKLATLPLQIVLLRRFVAENPNAVLHAHPLYYMVLCWAAGVKCGVTPQGSEILVRPMRSRLYGFFATRALRAASFVTVDSVAMMMAVRELSGVEALVVQNGIDVEKVRSYASSRERTRICSIRGFTPLYRIADVVAARNHATPGVPITFLYPLVDADYHTKVSADFVEGDEDLGRLMKDELYQLLGETLLTISVPSSDSSPRSVYEAIFAGSCVAAVFNTYLDLLPACMRARVFVVDLNDRDWFVRAVEFAVARKNLSFVPSSEAVQQYDQYVSMKTIVNNIYG